MFQPFGSASITTDLTGVKAGEMRYKPFGEYRVDTGDVKGNKRFQGSERVSSIELDSMGARFYSAGFGRFVSADTIVPGAGNPQNFNRYSFVLNNPLKFVDPSGHAQIAPEGNGCGTSDLRSCFVSQYQSLGWGIGGINYAEGTLYQLIYERYQTIKPHGWEIKSEGLPEMIAQQYLQSDFNMPVVKRPINWGDVVWTIMAQSGGLHMAGAVIAGTKPGGSVDIRLKQLSNTAFNFLSGAADTEVYYGVRDGQRVYVGITKDIDARQTQHGSRFQLESITTEKVTRGQARAIEQALIVENPQFENIRNSISPSQPYYQEAVNWGKNWLIERGLLKP